MVSDIFHGILKKGNAHSFFRQFFPGPAGMIGSMKVGLRMRHHAHQSSRFITDSSHGINRPVRVEGVIHAGFFKRFIRILKGDQLLLFQLLLNRLIPGNELSLSMPDGKINTLSSLL